MTSPYTSVLDSPTSFEPMQASLSPPAVSLSHTACRLTDQQHQINMCTWQGIITALSKVKTGFTHSKALMAAFLLPVNRLLLLTLHTIRSAVLASVPKCTETTGKHICLWPPLENGMNHIHWQIRDIVVSACRYCCRITFWEVRKVKKKKKATHKPIHFAVKCVTCI